MPDQTAQPGRITSLADLRPGDLLFGPIGGLVPGIFPVGVGQLILGESFRAGRLAPRHVGVVTQAGVRHPGWTNPRLVQAMPRGAEEIELRDSTHWTDRHAYVRLPEDYPGQAEDAAAIARLFVTERVPYSFLSYFALAAWKFGAKPPAASGPGVRKLEAWINRRRAPIPVIRHEPLHNVIPGYAETYEGSIELPTEAICSVLADQAWSLAGKRVMEGVAHQAVTPGAMALQLWRRPGVIWGGKGLLESAE